MTELTQMILTLDSASAEALKEADASAQSVMKEADSRADALLEERQRHLAKQKAGEAAALAEKLDGERREAAAALQRKMEAFDRSFESDAALEYLIAAAKARVCR